MLSGLRQTRGPVAISPLLTLLTKALQEPRGKTRAGPCLSFESRTPTDRGSTAVSMQLLPVPSLYEDLYQADSGATTVDG